MTQKIMSLRGENNADGSYDWEGAVTDSAIMGAVTFFSALGGMSAVGIPTTESFVAALIAGATQFFIALAIKRGLRKPE